MSTLTTAKVIRRVRKRLKVSQEGLSRLLNATKGAVQHWERGRNNPDLARLMALRQICPPSPERKELDALIRQTQAQVAPLGAEGEAPAVKPGVGPVRAARGLIPYPEARLQALRRENSRLQRQLTKLQLDLRGRDEKLRILDELAKDLQREVAELRVGQSGKGGRPAAPASSAE